MAAKKNLGLLCSPWITLSDISTAILGEIEIIQDEFSEALIEKPNEMTMDVSYSLRLADQFSMGVSLRYLRSCN